MDISVIVPIYGVEKYIDRSLRSLFSQTKTDGVEFILVNDCTLDGSMEVAGKVIADFPTLDIKVVNHEVNRGLAAARQTGMDNAKGNYVIHIDSDDWCEPQMLEELYNCALSNNADIVGCDFYKSYPDRSLYLGQLLPNNVGECIDHLLCGKIYNSVWNKLYKREIFVKNNIRWASGLDMCEDLLINSKILPCVKSICYLPKAYVHYVQRDESYVSQISAKSIRSMVGVIDEIESYYSEIGIIENYRDSLLVLISVPLKLGQVKN